MVQKGDQQRNINSKELVYVSDVQGVAGRNNICSILNFK
jgi:hypothetical protein